MKERILKILKKMNNGISFINNKYKKIYDTKLKLIFQFLPSNVYLLLLFVILSIIVIPKITNNYTSTYSTGIGEKDAIEIIDKGISQTINTEKSKKIDAIGVIFSTFMRKNNSVYEIKIYKNDKAIFKEKINASKLEDNKEVIFNVNQNVKKGDIFKYEINPIKAKKGNGITVLKDLAGSYVYRVYEKSRFYNFVIIFSIFLLITFFIINYLINNNKIQKEENIYKVLFIYLLLSVFIYPPMFVPDSSYHFNRSYMVSQTSILKFFTSNNFNQKQQPSNLDCLYYGSVNNNLVNVMDTDDIVNCFDSKKMMNKSYKLRIDNKIAYFFSGLGIKIANIFTDSPMILFFTGRLFNALVSFLIILYALKIAPKHKRVLLLIALIPVFIQQMCSYSYDSLLNSLCILIIAYLIKFYSNKEQISIKDLLIYTISLSVVFIIKLPYVLIGLPIIFLNKEKFKTKKFNKLIYVFVLFLILAISYLLPKLGGNLGFIDTTGSGDRGMSLNNLFNIKYTIKMIYYTFKYEIIMYLESFVGSLGWLNGADMPRLFIYSYLFFSIIVVASEKQYFNVKLKNRLIIIFLNLILIGGIFLSMYLSWTMPGSKYIQGVQGRYFYAPILSLMLVLIPKNNIINISNRTVYSFINISCLLYLISILYLFY